MSRALCQISKSPFTSHIRRAKLPHHFSQPTFTIYNGRIDPVKHVSYFNQRMDIHSRNKALICKVFLSSLGPIIVRWFDGLEEGLIGSNEKLTRAFEAKFMTCSRILSSFDSLPSMEMKEGETLKTYFDRYWELFNEIDGDFEDVVIKTFKVGLPMNSGLRKSLTIKPARNMHQLMDHLDNHKRVEDDQVQGKGKDKVFTPKWKDPQPDRFGPNRPRRDFLIKLPKVIPRWLAWCSRNPYIGSMKRSRMSPTSSGPTRWGDPTKWNQNLYC